MDPANQSVEQAAVVAVVEAAVSRAAEELAASVDASSIEVVESSSVAPPALASSSSAPVGPFDSSTFVADSNIIRNESAAVPVPTFSETADEFFQRLVKSEHIDQGTIEFYQLVSSVMRFSSEPNNFKVFFAQHSTSKDKRVALRNMLLLGVERLLDNNQGYRTIVINIFDEDNIIGTTTSLVFQLMQMVQSSSTKKNRISGNDKRTFVRSTINNYLNFTDISLSDRHLIMAGLDVTISAFIMAKHGALQLRNTCKDNGWCCFSK